MANQRSFTNYHYLHEEDGGLLRVRSKNGRPSKKVPTRDGTYIVNEFNIKSGKWIQPCFSQITAHRLFNKCLYLGSTKGDDGE